jgi:4-amino-4-deoxy-L-arabinose transferase-like glycosyltransferase
MDARRCLRTLAAAPGWARGLWAATLFPGRVRWRPREDAPEWHLLALGCLASLLFLGRLGCPLLEPEEARYAEIPRQMLAEDTFAVPVLHGETYFHKPPLLYWLIMGAYTVLGVEDRVARLVPGLAGVLTVLLVYLWGRRAVGPRGAFLAGLILCLAPRFLYLGRMLTTESVLYLSVTAALLAAFPAVYSPTLRWRWWLVSAFCTGLGFLAKGPVALALVGPPVLAFQLLDRRACRPRVIAWLAYGAAAVAVALPWYATLVIEHPRAAAEFFWLHNVVRFVEPFDHAKPFWFHLPGLVLGMLPWTLLLWPLGRFLLRRAAAGRRPPALGFFLLAFLWCVTFYSAAGCKRAVYILPALPLLALVLGCYLGQALPWRRIAHTSFMLPARGEALAQRLTLALLCLAAGVCFAAVVAKLWRQEEGLFAAGVLVLGAAVLTWQGRRLAAGASWVACGLTLFALLLGALHEVLPDYNRRFAVRGHVRACREVARDDMPVACYPRRWDSVSFYLGRDDVDVYPQERLRELVADLESRPRTLVFVKAGGSLEDFRKALPPSLDFVPIGRQSGNVRAGLVRWRDAGRGTVLARR